MITNSRKRASGCKSIEITLVPQCFDNSVARSGKWTPEEENFANRLIVDFESGSLVDCEDGCTLRSYLAKKLNCAPMRISKKFAGKCIGKHIFSKKHEISDDNNTLNDLEISFKQSYKESNNNDSGISESHLKIMKTSHGRDLLKNNDKLESKSALLATLKKQINNAIYGDQGLQDNNIGLDIDDVYNASNSGSFSSFSSFNSLQPTESSCDEAEEWKDVLSFFCCDGKALSPEQIEAGMNLVRRDSSFIIKSNSLRKLLNSNYNE